MTTVGSGAPVRRTRGQMALVAGAVAAGVALVATLGFLFVRSRAGAVDVGVRSFSLAPATATITFEVVKPAERTVTCVLRARDARQVVVGRSAGVVLGPAAQRQVVRTETFGTTAPATVVEVESCRFTP